MGIKVGTIYDSTSYGGREQGNGRNRGPTPNNSRDAKIEAILSQFLTKLQSIESSRDASLDQRMKARNTPLDGRSEARDAALYQRVEACNALLDKHSEGRNAHIIHCPG
ncbi:hypothetical protein HAX54_029569, partial [Datura stramonium]|nr:hypothetical protein [Datura stramonium]